MNPIIFTKIQLESLNLLVNKTIENVNGNIDYKLDFIKFFIHPDTNSDIHVKIRTHGFSSGEPFDNIDYKVINTDGETNKLELIVRDLSAKFTFLAGLREIKLVNGKPQFVK
jgi:hypothetical protein